jgi:hypothetical protein
MATSSHYQYGGRRRRNPCSSTMIMKKMFLRKIAGSGMETAGRGCLVF